jgi:hypothetical protein
METMMQGFKTFCDLPSIHGAIDGIHFSISKPSRHFSKKYYYHKIRGYIVVCQVVVDDRK